MNRNTFKKLLHLWPITILLLLIIALVARSIIPLLFIILVILLLLANRYGWIDWVFDKLKAFERRFYRKSEPTVYYYQPPKQATRRRERPTAQPKGQWDDYEQARAQYPEQLPPMEQ